MEFERSWPDGVDAPRTPSGHLDAAPIVKSHRILLQRSFVGLVLEEKHISDF